MHRDLLYGPGGDRTLDLRVANAALSQLSYEPISSLPVSGTHILYHKEDGLSRPLRADFSLPGRSCFVQATIRTSIDISARKCYNQYMQAAHPCDAGALFLYQDNMKGWMMDEKLF